MSTMSAGRKGGTFRRLVVWCTPRLVYNNRIVAVVVALYTLQPLDNNEEEYIIHFPI